MIRTFRNKALAELFETGQSAKIDVKMRKRILLRLDRLDAAQRPEDMNLPGFDFHALNGFNPTRYTVHVNGPWCITFEFDGQDATRVDFEQYH
ncbi:plasmid maintenance system killer [Pleomorphomonas diazotrophica]|uniref:Plasmid maintenance system killer n=1 Tax=Pleomorphomonas diazotrophica TaxID=1166257 RepID=A0A1I4UHP3_9HYPH|nr:type II toxin-antitoxin system RelE/ParE family toxin [Pleomorphomonas diazotrophica]PKR89172.1 plasmid maintenance system killer [Pleomorphomonas diazotrophica]SFM88509.1 proteic killer suppression protein [Pleomorphomonas diazotrophica]